MKSLVYNTDHFDIDTFRRNLPHAALLEGIYGVGLLTLALAVAGNQLAGIVQPTDRDGKIDLLRGSIKATQIRNLYETTKGKSSSRQIYIIDDAEKMVTAAQHSFLKLLEEPAANVHFLLTSHDSSKLLPTVLSRVQRTTIRTVSTDQSRALIASLGMFDNHQVSQLLFIADGRPAELSRLTTNPEEFSRQISFVTDARQLLQGDAFAKLSIIQSYQSDRQATLQLLRSAQTILAHSMNHADPRSLIKTAEQLATIYDRISANGNVKLQLATIVV